MAGFRSPRTDMTVQVVDAAGANVDGFEIDFTAWPLTL